MQGVIEGLYGLSDLPKNTVLPVDDWNPPFCGDIDMRIDARGNWHYNGSPIHRPAMVQLFSRLVRLETDSYFLVTPVEKVGIQVEDVPFVAVEMEDKDGQLTFLTNVGDRVTVSQTHPLRFETHADQFRPYVCVRSNLFARLSRQLARDLSSMGSHDMIDGVSWFGIATSGIFFPIVQTLSISDV